MATRPQKIQKVTDQPSTSAPSASEARDDTSLTGSSALNGPEVWQQQRSEWVDNAARADRVPSRPVISSDSTYETLLLNFRPFPVRIPLAEMVDFLQEAWSEEGLYG